MRDFNMKVILIFIFIFFTFSALQAGLVIEVSSDEKDIEQIVGKYKTKIEHDINFVDSLNQALINIGYLDATVKFENGKEPKALIINSGQQYFLSSIIVSDKFIKSFSNLTFTKQNIDRAIEKILTSSTDSGFYYSTLVIDSVVSESIQVELFITLNKGPKIIIGDIEFRGLKKSNPEFLSNYFKESKNQDATGKTLNNLKQTARSVPFLYFDSLSVIPTEGFTSTDLLLHFREKKPFLFEGGGGYVPGNNSQLVWSLRANFENLFGEGRKLKIDAERKDKDRNILNLEYFQPIFLFHQDELQFRINSRDYRDEFYEFGFKGIFSTRLNQDFKTGVAVRYKSVDRENNQSSYSMYEGSFILQRGNPDNWLYIRNQISFKWEIGFSYRKYSDHLQINNSINIFNETRTTFTGFIEHNLSRLVSIFVKLNYIGLETNELLPPLSELSFIGGPGTLRGFKNEQFSAIRTAFGTIEPKLKFRTGFSFLFFDLAYLNNRIAESDQILTDEDFQYGYGFGIGLKSAETGLKISLGWSQSVSFDQPRLSVEFISEI